MVYLTIKKFIEKELQDYFTLLLYTYILVLNMVLKHLETVPKSI